MAQRGVLDEEQLRCSICLDLPKDPVTVPCGHSYCKGCIEGYWNQDDQRGRYSCPQCRQNFNPRPLLKKNTMLAGVVESLKMTGPPDHCYAGPGDVACDFCTGRRLKAVKTCLQCLVSYCDTHLVPHYQSSAFKTHKLVKASSKPDRQKELQTSQQNIQQKIQQRVEDAKLLHREVESINHFADKAVKDSDTVFTGLISAMERRRTEVKELIRDQQKREVSRAEELCRRVEQEVTELRKIHAELEHFSLTGDHIHFMQRYASSLSAFSESTHTVSSDARPLRYFQDVTVAVSKMREKVEATLSEERANVSAAVNEVDVLLSTTNLYEAVLSEGGTNVSEPVNRVNVLPPAVTRSEPKTRAEFLQYSRTITLDPNTAHRQLTLSNGNRKVARLTQAQSHPEHPERFNFWTQVLSKEGLTGRFYCEVEAIGHFLHIAASHKDISRAGSGVECKFGYNDKSWSLLCNKQDYNFRHRGIETHIPGPVSSRVGVYLDHSAGILSFYSVSDSTMTLLHTVHTTFTQNLHVGLRLCSYGLTAEFK